MKDMWKILIAYDESECAMAALADLKQAGLPRKADVHILSVHTEWMPQPSSLGMVETKFTRYLEQGGKAALAIAQRAEALLKLSFPEWKIHPEAMAGSPARLILERAENLKSDLIVLGSHGRSGLGRLLLGSVSQKVLHAAHSTVRIARGREKELGKPVRMIIGVDGSRGAEAAVKAVAARHWPQRSEVRIVNGFAVLPLIDGDYANAVLAEWIADEKARVAEMIETAVARLKRSGLKVSKVMRHEGARQLLISEAKSWEADCIFVGARGMGAVERFLIGSVSSYVATHAPCSVEVVPEEK